MGSTQRVNTNSTAVDWGMSGEYWFDLDVSNDERYQVTVTQSIEDRTALVTTDDNTTTFTIYGKPTWGDDGSLTVSKEFKYDLSGNKSEITGNMDICMIDLSAQFINKVELYRDNELFKRLLPNSSDADAVSVYEEKSTQDTKGLTGHS
jgi:hypothetical protein